MEAAATEQDTCLGSTQGYGYGGLHVAGTTVGPQDGCFSIGMPKIAASSVKILISIGSWQLLGDSVSVQWVPSHVGVQGNEQADRCPQQGATAALPSVREAKSVLE